MVHWDNPWQSPVFQVTSLLQEQLVDLPIWMKAQKVQHVPCKDMGLKQILADLHHAPIPNRLICASRHWAFLPFAENKQPGLLRFPHLAKASISTLNAF